MSEELIPQDFLIRPDLFETYFVNRENYMSIRQYALDGHLGAIHNRFTSWRIFLGILPESFSTDQWVSRITSLRTDYYNIVKSHRSVKTDNLDPLIFNPLSSATENPWNNFHVDNDLKNIIRNDVERTFQERPLFQVKEVQELMVSILFIWAKENPKISYKQGMNELLGIILFVAYAEQAPEQLNISQKAKECLQVMNDPAGIEADVYWCFVRLMQHGIAEMFNPVVTHQQGSKKPDLFTWEVERSHNDLVNQDKSAADNVSSVLKRCHRIHHRILQDVDKELYLYLERQKIEPQMYLQRYLRCVLSREFNLADTLILWDALFAHLTPGCDFKASGTQAEDLTLLDFICVAMIIFVRAFVLQSDYSGILRRLLKFPPVEDVHILVSMGVNYLEKIRGKSVKAHTIPHQIQPIFTPLKSSTPILKSSFAPQTAAPFIKGTFAPQNISPLGKSAFTASFAASSPKNQLGPASQSPNPVLKHTFPSAGSSSPVLVTASSEKIWLDNKSPKNIAKNSEGSSPGIEKRSAEVNDPLLGGKANIGLSVKTEERKEIVKAEAGAVGKCNEALAIMVELSERQEFDEEKVGKVLKFLYSLRDELKG